MRGAYERNGIRMVGGRAGAGRVPNYMAMEVPIIERDDDRPPGDSAPRVHPVREPVYRNGIRVIRDIIEMPQRAWTTHGLEDPARARSDPSVRELLEELVRMERMKEEIRRPDPLLARIGDAYLIGNRGGVISVTAPTSSSNGPVGVGAPAADVQWSDKVARTGFVTLGLNPIGESATAPTPAKPATYTPLVAFLEWSTGSSARLTAFVDVGQGVTFPLTFKQLSINLLVDHVAGATTEATTTGYVGIAPVSYSFGQPTRTQRLQLSNTTPATGEINLPAFATGARVYWDKPDSQSMKVKCDIVDGGWTPPIIFASSGSSGVGLFTIPNNTYGLVFSSEAQTTVTVVFDLGLR